MKKRLIILLSVFALMLSCKKVNDVSGDSENYSTVPTLPETPDDYQNSINDRLATLGRVLFYDKNLSLNNSVSCGSCHLQSKAFCDNLTASVGLEDQKTSRNTPSIFAKGGRMFWDGRASNFGNLALRPVKNHVEMKFDDLNALCEKLAKTSYYPALFEKAYGNAGIDSNRIAEALTEFLVNFNFSGNKFNTSIQNPAILNASEKLGKEIFFGRGQCDNCHHLNTAITLVPGGINSGYGFTDMEFNIGLDQIYQDNGVGEITKNTEDEGKFMVPVLLNVEYTAPYMHDGRFKTLEEVVEHYNSNIKNHPNLDVNLRDIDHIQNMSESDILALLDANHNGEIELSEIRNIPPRKLNLNSAEKKGLVDFLKTLSDASIFTNKKFSTPFVKK